MKNLSRRGILIITAIIAVLALNTVVVAGIGGPGNLSGNVAVNGSDQKEEVNENEGGAELKVKAEIKEDGSGGASASGSAIADSGSWADAKIEAKIDKDASGTATATGSAVATEGSEAKADAKAELKGTGTVTANADADASGYGEYSGFARAKSESKIEKDASGDIGTNSIATAVSGGYAEAEAKAKIKKDDSGSIIAWSWATATGSDAWAKSKIDIDSGSAVSSGVFWDYDAQGASFAISLLIVQDPNNIFAFTVSNASGDMNAIADIKIKGDGDDIKVDADVNNTPT